MVVGNFDSGQHTIAPPVPAFAVVDHRSVTLTELQSRRAQPVSRRRHNDLGRKTRRRRPLLVGNPVNGTMAPRSLNQLEQVVAVNSYLDGASELSRLTKSVFPDAEHHRADICRS